jgi:glycosyltransferase involved in cell wall biosynthesis
MKILYATTVSSTMNAFFKAHIEMLVREGHSVDLACNDTGWPIDDFYKMLGCRYHHVDFSRSPISSDNMKAYGQLKKVIKNGGYDIVHCHTPNASVITRLVCRKFRKKNGLKVFYTAHGFHFYKGAPKLNWMVYYPVEKLCSRFTDKLITINKEDYELAKNKFRAKEVHYVPGVGIDLSRFENVQIDKAEKRKEIGVLEESFLLLSVGELNENKNHQIIIRALAKLNDPNVHYAIAGVGDKKEYLLSLANELGVSEQVHLLGYRKDIPALNHAADVFCFPSLREGLGLAAIEAMACGLPLLTSNVHGINDYSTDGATGYSFAPTDVDGFVCGIERLKNDSFLRRIMGEYNMACSGRYGIEEVKPIMKKIYEIKISEEQYV